MAKYAEQSDSTTRNTRQDLFGFSRPANRHADQCLPDTWAAIRTLWTLGLHIREQTPGHWVVRGRSPLPEIHLYSEHEVQRFAACNALHYSPVHRVKANKVTVVSTIEETA